MTIIQPNTHRFRIHAAFILVIVLVVGGALLNIFLYNETVQLNHSIRVATEDIKGLQAENADVRNELYKVLDPEHLKATALELGFVKDTAPRYIEITNNAIQAGL